MPDNPDAPKLEVGDTVRVTIEGVSGLYAVDYIDARTGVYTLTPVDVPPPS